MKQLSKGRFVINFSPLPLTKINSKYSCRRQRVGACAWLNLIFFQFDKSLDAI
jgi:hypothetical protein